MQILSTVDLTKSFKGRKVVDDVNLRLAQGEVIGLLGPNGAGKTTTFYIIVGLTGPDSGQVLLDGMDITSLPMYLRARNGISYLPQEPSIFRKLTVEENIVAVLETLPLSAHQRRERLEELIADFGLQQVRRSYGYVLSGGGPRRPSRRAGRAGGGVAARAGLFQRLRLRLRPRQKPRPPPHPPPAAVR